jgi:hypothetical protein
MEGIIREIGEWAVGADDLQWILYRRKGRDAWRSLSYVSSTLRVLERCAAEKGCELATARKLVAGLPDTFGAWKTAQAKTERPKHGSCAPALQPALQR